MSTCDNQSVGVIVQNSGEFLLLQRAKFPWGLAPPAGHIDEHGTPEQAATAETYEEVGIELPLSSLVKVIANRRIDNKCRRSGGEYHDWTVFTAESSTRETVASEEETNGLYWLNSEQLQDLADYTRSTDPSNVNQKSRILEKVWLDFFVDLKFVR